MRSAGVVILADDSIRGFKSNDRTQPEAAFATGGFAAKAVVHAATQFHIEFGQWYPRTL
jgi:hypothetical protein